MAPGRKPTKGKAALASKPAAPATPAKKKTPAKTAAKVAEPESESESESQGEEVEETIYEEMSDDSAVEDAIDSDQDNNSDEDGADASVEDDEEVEEKYGADIVPLEEDSDASESEIDEDALLAGLKGSDSEISDSEGEEDVFRSGQGKIDIDGKASAKIRARLDKLKKTSGKPGVVYIGRIPHGFYEEQMMGYFKQFGTIKRLRLSRNPSTGRSRHYAFIEFAHHEVAKIVAETMNNYLMFERLLKCSVVPEDKVHPRLFVNRNASIAPGQRLRAHQTAHNRQRTQTEVQAMVGRLVTKENKKRAKLAAAGIDYDFPGYKGARPPRAKHVKYNDSD